MAGFGSGSINVHKMFMHKVPKNDIVKLSFGATGTNELKSSKRVLGSALSISTPITECEY